MRPASPSFMPRASESLSMTVGGDTFIHDLLDRARFTNVFGEQPRYPVGDGTVSFAKPVADERSTLDCATGIGSFVGVTACFGFAAASHAIRKYLKAVGVLQPVAR